MRHLITTRTPTPTPTLILTLTVTLLLVGLFPMDARADIYMYTDKDGVTHFTNIRPTGRKYTQLYKARAGKPSAQRCKGCDVVAARDSSKDRFTRYDPFIYGAARLYKIPVALIRAVMETESDYDPRVVSSAGAKGLMQLMPVTARHMGVTDVFDPRQNIYGGVRYLRVLANTFHGNLLLTIAGYHAGPGAVARFGGIPPYETTQRYVPIVMRRYFRYQRMEAARRQAGEAALVATPSAPGASQATGGADGTSEAGASGGSVGAPGVAAPGRGDPAGGGRSRPALPANRDVPE